MKRHYIVQALLRQNDQEFLCPIGAVCTQEELNGILRRQSAISYKIKSIDGEPVVGWEDTGWISTQ